MIKNCLLLSLIAFGVISCNGNQVAEKSYDIQVNVRLDFKFYSIYLDGNGKGYVAKGNAVAGRLKDSADVFINTLKRLQEKPVVRGKSTSSFPRVEVYYKRVKVYDAYRWDGMILDRFQFILPQLPVEFNPFLVEKDPFELNQQSS